MYRLARSRREFMLELEENSLDQTKTQFCSRNAKLNLTFREQKEKWDQFRLKFTYSPLTRETSLPTSNAGRRNRRAHLEPAHSHSDRWGGASGVAELVVGEQPPAQAQRPQLEPVRSSGRRQVRRRGWKVRDRMDEAKSREADGTPRRRCSMAGLLILLNEKITECRIV